MLTSQVIADKQEQLPGEDSHYLYWHPDDEDDSSQSAKGCQAVHGESNPTQEYTPDEIVVLGDSIAVGLFRDTEAGGRASFAHPMVIAVVTRRPWREFIATADSFYKNHSSFSAFTAKASECPSVASSLGKPKTKVSNWAVSGSQVSNLVGQLRQKKVVKRRVIIASIGGNDICAPTYNLGRQRRDLQSFFQYLESQTDPTSEDYPRVLLVPPPNPVALFETLKPSDMAMSFGLGIRYSCSQVRDGRQPGSSLCPRLTYATKEGLQEISAEYQKMIDMFEEVASIQQHIVTVVVSGMNNVEISKKMIAFDCFHPSEEGHREIAKIVVPKAEELLQIRKIHED